MKQFILVAGIDYDFSLVTQGTNSSPPKDRRVDFRIFCDSREKHLIAANNKKDDLKFMIFDFRRGEVITHEITYAGGKQTQKSNKLTPFKPITKANYTYVDSDYRFKDGQKGIMSILDIYKAVQKVGQDAPHTLIELSFFSHAYLGGPILVNSYDDGFMLAGPGGRRTRLPSGVRDPDDMDPRLKDFKPPIMDSAALTNFQNAFHADGHIWIWGCAFPHPLHEILTKIEKHPSYKDSGVGDDVVFRITNFNNEEADYLEELISPVIGGPFPDKKKIEVKFKFLKYFFCQVTIASYTHHIAENAKVKAFGGVMGTYSEYDQSSLPLMRVNPGFAKHFTFYKNYLGFGFDPEGRNYGEYKPTFTCIAPKP